LLTDLSAHDKELLTSWRSVANNHMPRLIAAASANYTLPNISDGTGCTADTWTLTSLTNAPPARANHTAVWTGSEMIVWGGASSGPTYFNTGGRYAYIDAGDRSTTTTDTWTATSTAPAARARHTAVSAGTGSDVSG